MFIDGSRQRIIDRDATLEHLFSEVVEWLRLQPGAKFNVWFTNDVHGMQQKTVWEPTRQTIRSFFRFYDNEHAEIFVHLKQPNERETDIYRFYTVPGAAPPPPPPPQQPRRARLIEIRFGYPESTLIFINRDTTLKNLFGIVWRKLGTPFRLHVHTSVSGNEPYVRLWEPVRQQTLRDVLGRWADDPGAYVFAKTKTSVNTNANFGRGNNGASGSRPRPTPTANRSNAATKRAATKRFVHEHTDEALRLCRATCQDGVLNECTRDMLAELVTKVIGSGAARSGKNMLPKAELCAKLLARGS